MIETVFINNKEYVKKEVNNIMVYYHLKSLNLSNIPAIYKIEGSIIYYEYIDGNSLYNLLKNNKLNQTERITIGLQLINGLKTINDNFIIHKDLKPENIIISRKGQLFFIDFGASRLYDGAKERDTVLLGTQNYASPEHYGYSETSFQSDMYSLGKILQDLKLPILFDKIIDQCIQLNPDDRYATYQDLLYDYENMQKSNYNIIIRNKPKAIIIIKQLFNQEYGYNFDNSNGQKIFTIISGLFSCLLFSQVIFNDIEKNNILDIPITILAGLYTFFVITFSADFIRITFISRPKKKGVYYKYFVRFIINLIIFHITLYIIFGILYLFNVIPEY